MVCCKGTPAGSGTSIKKPAVNGTSKKIIDSIFHQFCLIIFRCKLTNVCIAKMGVLTLIKFNKKRKFINCDNLFLL
jgi:hypothetical protein